MTVSHLRVIGASLGIAALLSYTIGVGAKTYQVKRELAPAAAAFERAAEDYTSAEFELDRLEMSVEEDDPHEIRWDRHVKQKEEAWSRIEQALGERDGIIERYGCTRGHWYVAADHLRSPDTTSPLCLNPFSK